MSHIVDENKDRKRQYGKRVGDVVRITYPPCYDFVTEIIGLKGLDNNSLHVIWKNGSVMSYVAEWCEIVTKVEDRCDFDIATVEHTIHEKFGKFMETSPWERIQAFKDYDQEWIDNFITQPYRAGKLSVDMMTYYLSESEFQVFPPRE